MQCAIGNLQTVLSAKSMRTISPICGKENLASLVQEFRRQSRHSVESCMINLGAGGGARPYGQPMERRAGKG